MSYEPIDDSGRIVTLRKAARCEWCAQSMLPGEQAVTRVYKVCGSFHSARMHPECYSAMRTYFTRSDVDLDGYFDGHFMVRGKPFHCDEIQPVVKESG